MKFTTSSGTVVTATNSTAAAAMAAEYGLGTIVGPVAEKPARRAPKMSVATAVRLFAEAQEWPQCGQDWPMGAQQRAAAEVIAAHPGCTDHIW